MAAQTYIMQNGGSNEQMTMVDEISVGDNQNMSQEIGDIADLGDIADEEDKQFYEEDQLMQVGQEIDNHLGIVNGVRLNMDGRPRKKKKKNGENRGLTG